MKGAIASQSKRMPQNIDVSNLDTADSLLSIYARVATSAATEKDTDLRRLDVIIRALNGANAVLQTKAIKELNETIMRTEGHGPALVILEGLKRSRLRRLPGMPALPGDEEHSA